MGFLAVTKTTGEYLANAILEHLEKYDLNIQDCRGQGYDNGANMVGVNTGVKTRILNINPRAFFTPCGYSWNLLLVDAANSSVAELFGFIQKIYLLFSSSSKRWDLIKGKLKLTMKPLSDTRWESRVEAVKAVLLQFDEVIECIESLKNQTEQSDTLSDCDSIELSRMVVGLLNTLRTLYRAVTITAIVVRNSDAAAVATATELGCCRLNDDDNILGPHWSGDPEPVRHVPIRRRGNFETRSILTGACGALRPGRLTFVLGPSGAGKTTLLNILTARRNRDVSGCVVGGGRTAVLVGQHAALIPNLTAQETLFFAATLKLPDRTTREREYAQNNCICISSGPSVTAGGERKRLAIATELLTDPAVMLLDEPTSGLDSVSSMSVVKALKEMAVGGRTVACVLHQPSSRLYCAADDVILLAYGRTLYAGAVSDAPSILRRAGFECPLYYNMADYLLEVASGEHVGDLNLLENEVKSYTYELEKLARNDVGKKYKKDATVESEALLRRKGNVINSNTGYAASMCKQLRALLWRSSLGALRDVHLMQMRLICHVVVALLLSALYRGAGADAARVASNTACLFFFLLFLFFSNAMPTIHTFPVEANVVLQEHLNKWYSLPAYCASKIIAELPIQILCATAFCIPAWLMTGQPADPWRLSLAWLICILVTILAQTFGLVIGAACGVKLGLFVVPAANIPMLMFSEFFIPYHEMPSYLRFFANISYFRFAFDAFIQTAYGFGRETLRCSKDFCLFRYPEKYLEHLGLSMTITADICILVAWIVFLQIALLGVLAFRVWRTCR
ncbi:ATP-binding cassette sub-family G member 4 [Eumeta japonica]|uniref:ATP-binding cassette sub-family G member 4 n=1 Tax=Eumeta variegata TaxID=151549 RepID=A0A4C1ZLA7_EUMVA|nr:ATP-binding cassette sub-family G member 4 [Eumeta japonica]